MAAAALGYTTIRPLAEDIMYSRDRVISVIRAILARRDAGSPRPYSSKPRTRRLALAV